MKLSTPMKSELAPKGPPLVTKYRKAKRPDVGADKPEIVMVY